MVIAAVTLHSIPGKCILKGPNTALKSQNLCRVCTLFLGRVVRQFQAREPDLAVSESCRESYRFHDAMQVWTIVLLGRPLDSSQAYR
jgi:hypothetical protein